MLELKFFSKFLLWSWAAYYLFIGKKFEKSAIYCYVIGVVLLLAGSAVSIFLEVIDSSIYNISTIDTFFAIPIGIFSIIKVAKLFNKKDQLKQDRNDDVSG